MTTPCQNTDVLKELKLDVKHINKRLSTGDVELGGLHSKLETVIETTTSINKKLFVDNGSKCVQTRINRMESVIAVLLWLTGVVTVATVSLIATLILTFITR